MANMTLSMPDNVSEEMKQFSEVKWSEVARRAIEERASEIEFIDRLLKESKLQKTGL